MKKIRWCFVLIACFWGMCSVSLANTPQNNSRDSSDHWHFRVTPYGWLSGMHGAMTIRGNSAHVDMKPADLFSYIKDLDFVGQLHMEASKGNWAFLLDPTYIKLTTGATVGPIPATISPRIGIFDFGVFYRLNRLFWNSNAAEKPTIEAFVGGRFMSLESVLTLNPGPIQTQFSAKQNWVAPIVGGRINERVSRRWLLSLRGDVGGFGVDSNQLTWSVIALAHYTIRRHCILSFGYRALGEDYSVGAGSNRFALNLTMYGPLVGVTITW